MFDIDIKKTVQPKPNKITVYPVRAYFCRKI